MKKASQILGENLIRAFEESSRSANDVAAKSNVGQTTISAWLRKAKFNDPDFNPRLDQLQAVAEELGYTIADFFAENLGRYTDTPERAPHREATPPPQDAGVSPRTRSIIERLTAIERTHCSPPALYALIENALDLVQPAAGPGDYPGLNDLTAE